MFSFLILSGYFYYRSSDKKIDEVKEIVNLELAILIKYLQDEEKLKYDRDLTIAVSRWNEYHSNPEEFVL